MSGNCRSCGSSILPNVRLLIQQGRMWDSRYGRTKQHAEKRGCVDEIRCTGQGENCTQGTPRLHHSSDDGITFPSSSYAGLMARVEKVQLPDDAAGSAKRGNIV